MPSASPSRNPWQVAGAIMSLFLASNLAVSAAGAERVSIDTSRTKAGAIIIRTAERRLYFVTGPGVAIRYEVGVGRPDRQWIGTATITGKYLRPNWAPPAVVRLAQPELPAIIPSGSPSNPMGEAAMTLSGGAYAIHGTNRPASVGGFVSYGCVRMHNADILDLYARVVVGTSVTVLR